MSERSRIKNLLVVAAMLLAGYFWFTGQGQHSTTSNKASNAIQSRNQRPSPDKSDTVIAKAFANRQSNLQVSGEGVVIKLLPDDKSGSRHQKFVVRLSSGQTLLIAHNIDLAKRVSGLGEGDTVTFSGEYEWSAKGGALHWTHRDPDGSHPTGWIQHHGRTYQ
ncbi:MAG: DUF3465 domain-containing protein [Chlorobium sp.]|nr:DUF3465 domain-containing protein [Chlorobium sp.]